MDLNANLIEEKNLLHSVGAWITLVDLLLVTTDHIRVAANISNEVIWNGYTWTPLPIQLGTFREDKDEVPQLQVRICNITKIPQAYAEANDGLIGSEITFYEVNSKQLTETADVKNYSVDVIGSSFDRMWANFTLGLSNNPYTVKDPKDRILKNTCRFGFPNSVDERCPYTSSTYTDCPKTLQGCVTRNGETVSLRYGGFPAIGTNKIYVTN